MKKLTTNTTLFWAAVIGLASCASNSPTEVNQLEAKGQTKTCKSVVDHAQLRVEFPLHMIFTDFYKNLGGALTIDNIHLYLHTSGRLKSFSSKNYDRPENHYNYIERIYNFSEDNLSATLLTYYPNSNCTVSGSRTCKNYYRFGVSNGTVRMGFEADEDKIIKQVNGSIFDRFASDFDGDRPNQFLTYYDTNKDGIVDSSMDETFRFGFRFVAEANLSQTPFPYSVTMLDTEQQCRMTMPENFDIDDAIDDKYHVRVYVSRTNDDHLLYKAVDSLFERRALMCPSSLFSSGRFECVEEQVEAYNEKPEAPSNEPPSGSHSLSSPVNLRGAVYSSHSLELFWDRADSSIAIYKIFRDSKLIAAVDGTSYFDTRLSPSTDYSYSVVGITLNGDSSLVSSEVTLRTNP